MTLETRPEVVTPRDRTGAVGGGTPMSITALSQTVVCRYDALLPERGVARADAPMVVDEMVRLLDDE